MIDPFAPYLEIPESYSRWLGSLRWSETRDAIEYEDIGTFAFAAEIGLFLEGFDSTKPLVHFGFVLHLLHLLGYDHERDRGEMARLERRLRRRGGLREGLIERQ